jgi:hypothetical protein
MPHPATGLPPSDATAGHPAVAARLRAVPRLPALSLEAALRLDDTLGQRHDELMLRRFLRDYERHVEQLARAIETGEDRYVVVYGETLAVALGASADAHLVREPMEAWIDRMRHHRRLPGDHEGNSAVRFVWKGAGFGDDSVV